MGVQRVVNHLAGRCERKGRALPEKQSGQQSKSGRTLRIASLGLTDESICLTGSTFRLQKRYYIAETDMNEDTLWNIFAVTGSVEDYLRYSALRDKKNDNGRGNRS